jgi:hypothetical protein
MKTTTYFRFPSEEIWNDTAQTLGIAKTVTVIVTEGTFDEETGEELTPAEYGEELKWQYYTHDYSCDVVGTIYNDDGVYNEETGEVITPPTVMEGFHVNYIGEYPQELEEYVVTPATPYRKFAGH